jgi:hypothetical protein
MFPPKEQVTAQKYDFQFGTNVIGVCLSSSVKLTSIAGGPFGPSQLVRCALDGDAIKRAPRNMCRCPYLQHPLLACLLLVSRLVSRLV